jgi:hypothetical protein
MSRRELKIRIPDFSSFWIKNADNKSRRPPHLLTLLAENLVDFGFDLVDPAYSILLQIAARQGSRAKVFVGIDELARQTQTCPKTVRRAIIRLEEAGYLEVNLQERAATGVANSYSVAPLRRLLNLEEDGVVPVRPGQETQVLDGPPIDGTEEELLEFYRK